MDEDSEFSDTPLPIKEWTNIAAAHGDTDHAADWVEENIGDTHIGKRKTRLGPSSRQKKQKK